jgi:hypothetical protein
VTWTTPRDVRASLRKRWSSGAYLTALALAEPWQPLSVPIRGPRASELASHFEEVRGWVALWNSEQRLRVEHKQVGARTLGANTIPSRAWVDDRETLWTLVKAVDDVRTFRRLLDDTAAQSPKLAAWVTANPMKVLSLADDWSSILATVRWIDERAIPGMFLRHIDAPGVDTKFIERHRGLLATLLDLQLDPLRIHDESPRSDFEARYGFRKKPERIRFRLLNGSRLSGFSELTVRAAEFGARPAGVATVYVIENEITYLAFPEVPGAMVVLGGGYAVNLLAPLRWLTSTNLVYWGDIDTHGLAILGRLRTHFPRAASMLMDEATLLEHHSHWTREPAQALQPPATLSPVEKALWNDLSTHRHGPSIRLEQERIRFSAIRDYLARS